MNQKLLGDRSAVIALYVPIVHRGYLDFLKKFGSNSDTLYLIGENLFKEFSPLHKEIRALESKDIKRILMSLGLFKNIIILTKKTIGSLKGLAIITANEDVSRSVINKYLKKNKTVFAPVFLRWDKSAVRSTSIVNYKNISTSVFDRSILKTIIAEGGKTSDWWREVGAAIVKNKKIILKARNAHVPSDHINYINGDPRDVIEAGKDTELSTVLHAEAALITEAAKKGVKLDGASIYTTVFPCPVCAKLIAYSGIKKCFFESGHASLDGETILKLKGVEIILVK